MAYCYAVAGNRDRDRESYSYHKFSGPVSGQIQEVYVQDGSSNKGHAVDYIVSFLELCGSALIVRKFFVFCTTHIFSASYLLYLVAPIFNNVVYLLSATIQFYFCFTFSYTKITSILYAYNIWNPFPEIKVFVSVITIH